MISWRTMPVDIPEYFKKCTIKFNVHSLPKNLHRKIEPVLVGSDAMKYFMSGFMYHYMYIHIDVSISADIFKSLKKAVPITSTIATKQRQ